MSVGIVRVIGLGSFINPKKGGKYGGEEDFDDCRGFCGGL